MTGYIHSVQSLGTLDGPGVRCVVFGEGCPLRCAYCHNPDTWAQKAEHAREVDALAAQILRLAPYIKEGGVTLSGGEPCVQAAFFTELASRLKERDLHIALDTAGVVDTPEVDRLLNYIDLVLLDVKFTSEDEYLKHTGGSLQRVLAFLEKLSERRIPVWIRHVLVPGLTDSEEELDRLLALTHTFSNIKRYELLPFKKLCLEKYKALGIPFPLADTPELGADRLEELKTHLSARLQDLGSRAEIG